MYAYHLNYLVSNIHVYMYLCPIDLSKENTTATTDHIVTTPSVIGQRSPLQNHTPNTVIQRGHHRNRDDMNGAVK